MANEATLPSSFAAQARGNSAYGPNPAFLHLRQQTDDEYKKSLGFDLKKLERISGKLIANWAPLTVGPHYKSPQFNAKPAPTTAQKIDTWLTKTYAKLLYIFEDSKYDISFYATLPHPPPKLDWAAKIAQKSCQLKVYK